MINNYSILNQRKYFSLNGLQNYLVFAQIFISLNILVAIMELKCGILQEYPKNVLKIHYSRFGRVKFKGICLK